MPDTVGTHHDTVELVSVYRRLLTWLGIGTALGACAELATLRPRPFSLPAWSGWPGRCSGSAPSAGVPGVPEPAAGGAPDPRRPGGDTAVPPALGWAVR
ncbi:hypothetical protein GCM10011374_09750 [Kocuria dechangensis]|uniref:Uncharacterized protein n=1 Tax=Kocuria dechangensis TaxID=1176249 RepID=A0A917LPN5_9MICC|nr:hypothetical protein GCM10011374_09750 [Kocuria dechangensis]